MIKGIVFDFDGLLVDSEPIYVSANKKFLLTRGIDDFTIFSRLFGMRAEETFELLKEHFSLEGTVEELMNERNGYIIEDFQDGLLCLRPYLLETLEILKTSFPLAIGSSSKKVLLDQALDIYKFGHYFSTIVCGDDVKKGKPEPDIYLEAAVRMNLSPNECIAVEDAPNGILSAKRAGMITVAIPNEQTANLEFPEPDFILEHLGELPEIIAKING